MATDLHDELFEDFVLESSERLERVEAALLDLEGELDESGAGDAPEPERLEELLRELHTLKGNAGLMGLGDLQTLAHDLEEAVGGVPAGSVAVRDVLGGLDRFRELLAAIAAGKGEGEGDGAAGGTAGLRVPFEALEALVEQLVQVVILRNRLEDALGRARDGALSAAAPVSLQELQVAYAPLARNLDRLQEQLLDLRMVPLGRLFRGLRRMVHDEAERCGKDVRLVARGGETPLDKALLEVASETLGHLVRNAVIHGVESPATREERSKPAVAEVAVSARGVSGEIHIEVSDDGGGVDREALLRKARERGHDPGDDAPLADLVFRPGLSRLAEADVGAGRGMGLAAVRDAVSRFQGRIEVWTEPGKGTGFRLRLPLSVSIARALLVEVDGAEYALPLATVVESRRLVPGASHRIDGGWVLPWRDVLVPLLDLGLFFGTARRFRDRGAAVVIEAGGRLRGLVVDELRGIRNLVVRGLEGVGRPPGLAGSSILGDGRVVLILDGADLAAASPLEGAA